MTDDIPRKNWVMIPFSKIYIDYQRWKHILDRKIVSVMKYPNDIYRAYISSKNNIGYLIWIAKNKYKGKLHLRYACQCRHFTIKIMPRSRNKYGIVKVMPNGDFTILIEDWHNLDKHAYLAASKLLEIKVPVALPLDQLIDFSLIDAGRYKRRFQKLGVSTLIELANLQTTPEMDNRVKKFKMRAKKLLKDIDLLEIKKDVFVAFDRKVELLP